MKSKSTQKGFTLIEVLVALLIFAIGMLGLAGLQLRAHQSSSYAQTRTIATLKATGLVERMRVNVTGVAAGDYSYDYGSDGDPAVVSGCEVESGGTCSPQDRATSDIAEWIQELGTALPILDDSGDIIAANADIVICRDSDPETQAGATPGAGIACDNDPNSWTVYIDWSDRRDVTNQVVQRYSFTFVP